MRFGQMSSIILLFQPFKFHCCMLTSKKDTLVKFCFLDCWRLCAAPTQLLFFLNSKKYYRYLWSSWYGTLQVHMALLDSENHF